MLAVVLCLTAGPLPSWPGIASALVFVALVWQIPRRRMGTCVGLTFAIYYALELVDVMIARVLPKEIASGLGSSSMAVPVQMLYMAQLTSVGAWVVIVCVALLCYYDAHRESPYASCLRFVAASSIVWASVSYVAERFATPSTGVYAPIEPLVPLVAFLAVPASFLFWHLKARTWTGLALRVSAALLLLAATYVMVAIGTGLLGSLAIRFPLLALFALAGAVGSKILHPYQAVVVLTWAAAIPFLRMALETGSLPSTGQNRRYPVIGVVFALAAAAMAFSFALDTHKQQIEAQAKQVEAAKDERAKQKLHAFLRWRISLPREAPKVLAALGPPVIGADGTAYVVARSERRLHAIDPSGQIRWSFSGVISAEPAVGRDTVYVVGIDKTLSALDQIDGRLRWSTKFAEGQALICTGPALAEDGTIYTLTQTDASAITLNATSPEGKLNWQLTRPAEHMCSIQDQVEMAPQLMPAPVASNGVLYFTHEGVLHAIDSDGAEKWSAPTDRPLARVLLGRNGGIYTYGEHLTAFNSDGKMEWSRRRNSAPSVAPSLGEDGTIYLPDQDGWIFLLALNPDGTEKWRSHDIPVSNVVAGPGGILYVSSPGLSALDSDGHPLDWHYGFGTPAIAPDGTIYSVEYDGDVYRLNPPSENIENVGTKMWDGSGGPLKPDFGLSGE